MHVRPFQPPDTDELYRVCLRTGDDGEDATRLFADPRLLGEVYVGPYLAFQPESALVVDADGVASAYALCAPDTAAFQRRCAEEWWPALRERYARDAFPAGTPDDEVVGIIYDPPRADPGLLAEYPAHLHIDLTPEVQGRGFGGELMRRLLREQTAAGVPGIHLEVATANLRAIGFYEHLDFTTLRVDGGTTIMGRRLTA
ncbi:MAG TPA: GNAT family N-acetyltransferase [Pseudolysinimonas sp.]|nr:GNAT family N-acetyltransferase [Pseudolysinimonas sp.]